MTQIVITGASAGISISTANQDPGLPVLVTETGVVSGVTNGIYGNAQAAWSIANLGAISAITGTKPAGIRLKAGGTVTNGSTSVTAASIYGNWYGVLGYAGAELDVTNFGTIKGAASAGVRLRDTGTITNGSTDVPTALIQGGGDGVHITGAAGAVFNDGTINGTTAFGVLLEAGGAIFNGAAEATGASIFGGLYGAVIESSIGTIDNQGTIIGSTSTGAWLDTSGTVTNGSPTNTSAQIAGGQNGVALDGGSATLVNYGTIAGTSAVGAYFDSGIAFNGASGSTAALISGGTIGISAGTLAATTVVNSGTILGTLADSAGIWLRFGGSVSNAGTISGGRDGVLIEYPTLAPAFSATNLGTIIGGQWGLRGFAAGVLTNGSPSDASAVISGGTFGAGIYGAGTLTNYGTIEGTDLVHGYGVYVPSDGTLANVGTLAVVSGPRFGVYGYHGGTVLNAGTISGGNAGIFTNGAMLIRNGSKTNHAAVISGGVASATAGVTVDNFAVLSGGALLNGGPSNRVIDHAGAVFLGALQANGTADTLELAADAKPGVLRGNFQGFETLAVDRNAAWQSKSALTLTPSATIALGNGGQLTASALLRVPGSLTLTGLGELAVGAAGRIVIGPAGGAAAGAITVAAHHGITGVGVLGGAVVDKGTITAKGGTLAVDGNVSGAGTIAIGNHALFAITGSMDAATHVTFLPGSGETLSVGQPGAGMGLIDGFAAGATIDLEGVGRATSVQSLGGGTFELSGFPGGAIDLHFTGTHSATLFRLADDGHGGTLLTYL